uniref:Glycerol-3-phosphate acyltransferase n=1 Tax=Solanum tuberosum TaxID=4113 RepID=M1BLP1_SOLTU
TRCSKSNPPEPWNWNIYLFPLWCLRVVVRYEILFPISFFVASWTGVVKYHGPRPSIRPKQGAFELGCTVCPVAIKYNKKFVDAFWNSRKQSFTMHILQLMTSWAVVCDVWYLEPQNIRPGETPIEFAERVRDIISVRAGLKMVPWDGYLKYSHPSPKHRERNNRADPLPAFY